MVFPTKILLIAALATVCHSFEADLDYVAAPRAESSGSPSESLAHKPQKLFETGRLTIGNDTSVIASLREVPSELHLCSAFFIRTDALLTTARCIYGKSTQNTYVHCLSRYQAGSGVSVPVKLLVPHPHFEVTPQMNNIGLILTQTYLPNAFVHTLPLPWQNHRGIVTMYQWKFSNDNKMFALYESDVSLITNGKCSLILKEFVECKYLCVGGVLVHQGSMDQGVPLSGKHHNLTYVLAIYNRDGTDRTVMAEKYEKIYPHVDWINYVLNANPISEKASDVTEEVKPIVPN